MSSTSSQICATSCLPLSRTGPGCSVPAPVIAQAWRNGVKQALLARFLHGCDRVDFTSQTAYAVGELLAAPGSADVVDAVVVLLAVRHGDIIVTSDPDDLGQLAAVLGVRLALRPIYCGAIPQSADTGAIM
jgi:hypothetical protein